MQSVCVQCVQQEGRRENREIFICKWHRNNEETKYLEILPVASIRVSGQYHPPPHSPAVPICSPPKVAPALRRMQLGGALEWLPPRWESLSLASGAL